MTATESRLHVRTVALPTPYPVGRVNTYVLGDERLGLIDTGVRSDTSLDLLATSLGGVEAFAKIDRVALTHRHFDHAGAAGTLQRRGAGPILCHADSLFDEARARRTFLALIERHGAPHELTRQLERVWAMGDHLGEDLRALEERIIIEDGASLRVGDVALEAISTPGHCPGHLCFVAREHRVVFCGDLLLADITANPLPHFDDAAPKGRRPSLSLYLQSLDRVERFGPMTGYPGHGEPLPDTAAAARAAREHILRRNEKVLRLVKRSEGRALFELAKSFFWEESVVGQALAYCELLAHVDLLEERDLVRLDPDTGLVESK